MANSDIWGLTAVVTPADSDTFVCQQSQGANATKITRQQLTANCAMGEVYYFSTTGTLVTIGSQSDGSTNMVKIAPATTFVAHRDTDNGGADNGRLRYTGTGTKTFHIAVTLSGTAQQPNDVFVIGAAKDGTVITASKVLGSSGGTQFSALHAMATLATNEYIEVYIGNTSAGRNFTIKSLNIFMMGMF